MGAIDEVKGPKSATKVPTQAPQQSLSNLFAFALANASNDPKTMELVLTNLAQQRAAVDAANQRKEDFENSVNLAKYHQDLAVAGEKAKQTETPQGVAETKTSQNQATLSDEAVTPEAVAGRKAAAETAAKSADVKLKGEELALSEAQRQAQAAPELEALQKRKDSADTHLAEINARYAEISKDPAMAKETAALELEQTKAQTEKIQAERDLAKAKAAGGGTVGGAVGNLDDMVKIYANSDNLQFNTPVEVAQSALDTADYFNAPDWMKSWVSQSMTGQPSDITGRAVAAKMRVLRVLKHTAPKMLTGTISATEQAELRTAFETLINTNPTLVSDMIYSIAIEDRNNGTLKLSGDEASRSQQWTDHIVAIARKAESTTGLKIQNLLRANAAAAGGVNANGSGTPSPNGPGAGQNAKSELEFGTKR
jgi:hypothetical protein